MKVFDNLVENENLDMVEIETEQWLSTHPSHEKRQAVLEELLPAALELREKVSVGKNYGLHIHTLYHNLLKYLSVS